MRAYVPYSEHSSTIKIDSYIPSYVENSPLVEGMRFTLARTVLLLVFIGLPVAVTQPGLSSLIGEESSDIFCCREQKELQLHEQRSKDSGMFTSVDNAL